MPKYIFVNSIPTETEAYSGPFSGSCSRLYKRLIAEAGIDLSDSAFLQVASNKLELKDICCSRTEAVKSYPIHIARYKAQFPDLLDFIPASYTWGELNAKQVLHPQHLGIYFNFIRRVKPLAFEANIFIAIGPFALWALTGLKGIEQYRGYVIETNFLPHPRKVIPTYSPISIVKNYTMQTIVKMDLEKIRTEGQTQTINYLEREINVAETIQDVEEYISQHLDNASHITFDIETSNCQITCIGFAPNTGTALVIPLTDTRNNDISTRFSYWRNPEDEKKVWHLINRVMSNPAVKIGQNGMYDLTYLNHFGIRVNNFSEDTMIMHHAMFSELPKSLEFLGSVYLNTPVWKTLRKQSHELKEGVDDEL